MPTTLRTNVSQAYWCSLAGGEARFEPAQTAPQGQTTISWFDMLFDGGIRLPHRDGKPLTMLVGGPPGSGKTTLAMEICYRLAKNEGGNAHGLSSLYVSTDSEAQRIIDNFTSFGYEEEDNRVQQHLSDVLDINPVRWRTFWEEIRNRSEPGIVLIRGKDSASQRKLLTEIVCSAVEALQHWFGMIVPPNLLDRLSVWWTTSAGARQAAPHILVIDSLNIVPSEQQRTFFEDFLAATSPVTQMIIFILDSTSTADSHKVWEYASDIVIRMDYDNTQDYYLRTIEVIKARYQRHEWGKHQVKIYKRPRTPDAADGDLNGNLRRDHPYRSQGGIFIYPSIHSYLSKYKHTAPPFEPKYVPTWPPRLRELVTFPEGRCTAFIGNRSGHKSHLGYLHLLHQIRDPNNIQESRNQATLVISLRDDEKMTRQTMAGILRQEPDFRKRLIQEYKILQELPSSHPDYERVCFNVGLKALDDLEHNDQLEVLYYHPGYITPEEFFHRMYISIHRLKRRNRKLTIMFNSVDQLGARFPLCARQKIFIPGIIETMSGEGATSIFIAVDEKDQPAEQYGLLPMADVILSFNPCQLSFDEYFAYLDEERNFEMQEASYRSQIFRYKEVQKEKRAGFKEEIVLRVERFAGGERAGAQGLLELIKDPTNSVYRDPGLHFTKLSSRFLLDRNPH